MDVPEASYCCSGCRSVAGVLESEQEEGDAANGLLRLGLAIFFTMNVMVFTMALWSQDIYPADSFTNPLAETLRSLFRWASLVFALPVLYLLGGPIARGVWQAIRSRRLTTDLMILAGVVAAYCYSLVSVLRDEGHIYFEVGAMVMVFVSIGRWLEAKGKHRTGASLDALANLLPATVRRVDDHGHISEVPREKVRTGEILRVLPGERFPVDGIITQGRATVDEQIVTGESVQVEKSACMNVYSGTLNLDGDLRIEVIAADGKETISRIVDMVRAARSVKGRHEKIADRIAAVFIPLVCVIAMVAGWRQGQIAGLDQGILTALSVVLIACPCALGMATPMAVWTALGRAAQGGLFFRSGVVMERLAGVRIACFDKTGTLTTGKPLASELHAALSADREQVLEIATLLAKGSIHSLSQAIVDYSHGQSISESDSSNTEIETWPGQGLSCDLPEFGRVVLGSRRFVEELGLSLPPELDQDSSAQQVFVGWDDCVQGVFGFCEQLRPEAALAIYECKGLGLELHLFSGDEGDRVVPLGEQVGVSTKGNMLPEDKAISLSTLKKRGLVAMVGDGLNDAPALATADVGVALGCGADVSRDAAGVCLLTDDLRRFPWAVGLARQTVRIVKQNLFWAFAYNSIGIGLAATGRLNPIWAALAMATSSILVVSNSLRLAHYSEPQSVDTAMSERNSVAVTQRPRESVNPQPELAEALL
ncbi:Copper-exporting P-type ATPase A [Bythopirellula polymerisocia]|uniref:Copper-exporting P-type ATPase A n=1 Tax=Bythopirellula polymerisocia TaxID=2528003 RepID=A0A5C6CYY8_9BACT|nr:Copper-exporting P-type ATPase A [Bythopirellula polymerisocia]